MVLLGGTGNNYGAILGGFVVWFIWIQSAPFALLVMRYRPRGLLPEKIIKN